jgi:putative cell wall-binding protein
VTTSRVGGANRYDTARLAALANFPGGSSTVILASGENFPDGLSASTLAGAMAVPLLLTPTAALAAETVSALATLHAHTVQIVGGPAAVSAAVIAQLQGLGYTVPAAIAGANRYETSAAVATAAAASAPVGTVNGLKTAIIATGLNFPDALSAGSAAYFAHLPILLTDSTTLSATVGPAIMSLGIKNALIMGGPSAVSAAVETSIKALNGGVTTTRVAGVTRFETAADMAQLDINPVFSGGLGMPAANIVLASGLNFPDALVAAEFKAPILLNDALPPASSTFLSTNAALISTITAIGGTAVISDADLTAAANAVSPVAGAATFAGNAGGTSFTVTFGAPINTPLVVTGVPQPNILLNNGVIPGAPLVQQTGASSFLVYNTPVLNPGDVISINGANPPTAASNGAKVPVSSFTIGANAAPAVVAVQFLVGGNAVSVQFSKPVHLNGGVTCTCGALAQLAGANGLSQDGTTYTFSTGATIVQANNLNITTAVTDMSAGLVPLPAAVQFSPTTNTALPIISATVLNPVTSLTQEGTLDASGTFGPTMVFSAKPGGAADGAHASGFEIQAIAGASFTVTTGACQAPGPAVGKTCIWIAYPAGAFTTNTQLAAALNANAVWNAVLVANGSGPLGLAATAGTNAAPTDIGTLGATVPGISFYAVTAILSKPVVPTNVVALNWTATTNGHAAVLFNVSTNVSSQPSVVTLTFGAASPATALVHGVTLLTFTGAAGNVFDFGGNQLTNGTQVTVS